MSNASRKYGFEKATDSLSYDDDEKNSHKKAFHKFPNKATQKTEGDENLLQLILYKIFHSF